MAKEERHVPVVPAQPTPPPQGTPAPDVGLRGRLNESLGNTAFPKPSTKVVNVDPLPTPPPKKQK